MGKKVSDGRVMPEAQSECFPGGDRLEYSRCGPIKGNVTITAAGACFECIFTILSNYAIWQSSIFNSGTQSGK
jgi:hypothetical protein